MIEGIIMVNGIGKKEHPMGVTEAAYKTIEILRKIWTNISTSISIQHFDDGTTFYDLNFRCGPYKRLAYSCPAIPVLLS